MGLGLAAGVGDGAEVGRADGRRVAPDGARLVVVAARLPLGFARGQLVVGQLVVERALLSTHGDDVAVLEQAHRDRKSVVEGKRVSVRVDLRCSRFTKKTIYTILALH